MSADVIVGGAPLSGFADHVRRYCGLDWSGGPPEVWAYRFFDALPTDEPDRITDADLVSVAAVHPGISKADVEWFADALPDLQLVLDEIDPRAELGRPDLATTDALDDLPSICEGRLALATRVLHRKRPEVVPMFGRHLTDRYRRSIDKRGEASWQGLLDAMALDLADEPNRAHLRTIRESLATELEIVPSTLRLLDVAVWMDAR